MDFELAEAEELRKAREAQRWIPVEERLPDEDGDYLVYKVFRLHGWCEVCSFAKDGRKVNKYDFADRWENVWFCYDSEWGYLVSDSVTYWMPLTEPQKEVTHDE